MNKLNKMISVNIITVLFILLFSCVCFGNSAGPPSILIIVSNAPDNFEIGIGSGTGYSKAKIVDKGVESYYIFYPRELSTIANHTLKIKNDDETFEIPIDKPLKSYNNVFTLDLKNKTLYPGKLLSRSILLVGLRIMLTLIIEGIIFYLMGFRRKKSWVAFLVINIVTQGALNILLNCFSPLASYTIMLSLILGEFLVFFSESIAFPIFVKEHSQLRKVAFVWFANSISLVAGGYIILNLPV